MYNLTDWVLQNGSWWADTKSRFKKFVRNKKLLKGTERKQNRAEEKL